MTAALACCNLARRSVSSSRTSTSPSWTSWPAVTGHFHDAGQQFRADGHFVNRANRTDRRFDHRLSDLPHGQDLSVVPGHLRLLGRRERYFRRKLPRQPEEQEGDYGRKHAKYGHATEPAPQQLRAT